MAFKALVLRFSEFQGRMAGAAGGFRMLAFKREPGRLVVKPDARQEFSPALG
jgi:hypothetical protein